MSALQKQLKNVIEGTKEMNQKYSFLHVNLN